MEVPLMFRVRGTVILTIWWQILLISIYTGCLVCLHEYIDNVQIQFPMTVVPVLGVVTGLLLVFRTNTAYDRSDEDLLPEVETYWEGRKIWSTMTWNIRTLTRCFWVLVDEKENSSQELVEKASAINLLVAFAYATRNYLREDYSYEEKDLKELIRHIPNFSTPSSNQPLKVQEELDTKNVECRQRNLKTASARSVSTRRRMYKSFSIMAFEKPVPTNIPIELSYYIASYIDSVRKRELVDCTTVGLMNNALNSLVDCLGGFERILRTPIPLAYSVHLHHATWLYLLALPYQLIGSLNWFAVPAVALAAFALLGILDIGWEIENPFGYDDNDLPLDDFCRVIHKEILTIVGHRMPSPDSWLLSEENRPLAMDTDLAASDLIRMKEPEVSRLLSKGCHIRLSSRRSFTAANKVSTRIPSSVIICQPDDMCKNENEDRLKYVTRNA